MSLRNLFLSSLLFLLFGSLCFCLVHFLHFHHLRALASVGLICNCILALTILVNAQLRKLAENIYVLAKALLDVIYLAAFIGEFHNVRAISFPVCALQDSLLLFARHTSMAIIICFMIVRFLAVVCPEEYRKWFSAIASWKWVFLVLPMLFAIWITMLAIFSIAPNESQAPLQTFDGTIQIPKCMRPQNAFRRISGFCFYILNFFLPFLLLCILSLLIALKRSYASSAEFMESMKSISRPTTAEGGEEEESDVKKAPKPMHSTVAWLLPTAWVLLNSLNYTFLFAFPPIQRQSFSDNSMVNVLDTIVQIANLGAFACNLPLFVLGKAFD